MTQPGAPGRFVPVNLGAQLHAGANAAMIHLVRPAPSTAAQFALCALLVCMLVCCSEDSRLSIDDLDGARRLADLDSDENAVLCDYSTHLADESLPPSGTQVTCGERTFTFRWSAECMFSAHVPADCMATVDDLHACLRAFLGGIGDDPCIVADIDSREGFEELLSESAQCESLSGCTY